LNHEPRAARREKHGEEEISHREHEAVLCFAYCVSCKMHEDSRNAEDTKVL